jgi:hypothetical protein
MLAGADYMKMGYVSRAHAKDNLHHFVLGTTLLRPSEFANQVPVCLRLRLCMCARTLEFRNGWRAQGKVCAKVCVVLPEVCVGVAPCHGAKVSFACALRRDLRPFC